MTSWQKRVKGIQVNDEVRYTRQWLQSVGAYTGDLPHAKGRVTELKTIGSITIATIDWNNTDIPEKVAVQNLNKVGQRERE